MKGLEETFFTLMKSALWNTTPVLHSDACDIDWKEIYDIAKEQTVSGIMLDAILKLPKEQMPDIALRLKWIMLQKSIEAQNCKMNSVLHSLVTEMKGEGTEPFLLKGQGMAQLYPIPGHRICGDIDIYFTPQHFESALEYFTSKGYELEGDPDDAHSETTYQDFKVELHKKSATFYTRRLQKRYNEIIGSLLEAEKGVTEIDGSEVITFPPMANALQLLSHMMRHIIFAGLGLRQVCDWVLFTYKFQKEIDKELFIRYTKELELWETYKAVTAIATDYLGLPKEYTVCELTSKDKKLAKKVFSLIMTYGNFGHYGEHSKAENQKEYFNSYLWKVKNCIRFRRLSKSETWNYPLWQLHSIKKVVKK